MKELVRERDGYACTKCGMTDVQHRIKYKQTIQVHRLVPGSAYAVGGCITVCQACHGPLPKRPRSGIKKAQRPGMTPIYFELPVADLKELESLVASLPLGNKADHMRFALKRHLAHPPTVAASALPPLAPPAVPPKVVPKKRPRAKKPPA